MFRTYPILSHLCKTLTWITSYHQSLSLEAANFNKIGLGTFFSSSVSVRPIVGVYFKTNKKTETLVNFLRAQHQPLEIEKYTLNRKNLPFGLLKMIFSYGDMWSLIVFEFLKNSMGKGKWNYLQPLLQVLQSSVTVCLCVRGRSVDRTGFLALGAFIYCGRGTPPRQSETNKRNQQ